VSGGFQGECVEDLIRKSFKELATNMSESRVSELYKYATSRDPGILGGGCRGGGGWDGKEMGSRKGSIQQNWAEMFLRGAYSVDDLFPEFPDCEGLIRPDAHKG
jgi:hypothetical protein